MTCIWSPWNAHKHPRRHWLRHGAVSYLALVDMLVALVKVVLDAVPVVDLDVIADPGYGGADGLERSILC